MLRLPSSQVHTATTLLRNTHCEVSWSRLPIFAGTFKNISILSFDFSLESGCFVDEEPYELVDFSLAVKTMRLDREAFQKDFR